MYETYFDQDSGIQFVFKYDESDPSLLHVYARHLTTPRDAIRTFKEGEAVWNQTYRRFESRTATHTLYWFWRVVGSVVVVISCYGKDAGTWTT